MGLTAQFDHQARNRGQSIFFIDSIENPDIVVFQSPRPLDHSAVDNLQLLGDIEQFREWETKISTGLRIFFLTMITHVLYSIVQLNYAPIGKAGSEALSGGCAMKRLSCGFLVLLATLGLVANAPTAFGQDVTAAIVGNVTYPSGAPVKDATVVATDTERGTVWKAQTNDTGAYNFQRLPIGSYTVKVTKEGFQTSLQPPFTIVLNQTARVDAQLKVGKVSETVEVSAAAPVLQTENAEVGTVLDARTNDNLPLATRNYVQLTLLTPGTVSVDPHSMNLGSNTAEEGGRPYINGNREQSNNFLLDGVDNNQASDNLLGLTPSPDAIGEFNLITQNASAEFGNYNGGIVNATIKSGTNRFHGDVFEFFRNDIFNANQWENGLPLTGALPTPKLRWNMFGGTLGGPILKDRLFFFAHFQGGRLAHPATTNAITVLTPAELSGNFSALCQTGFTGGICNDRSTDP